MANQPICAQVALIVPLVFHFNSVPIRAVADRNGDPWVCAADACRALGFTDPAQAIEIYCVLRGLVAVAIQGKPKPLGFTFICESNLFRLVEASPPDLRAQFEAWMMAELLPAFVGDSRPVPQLFV